MINDQRLRLYLIIALLLVSIVFWNSLFLYPIKLFVVLLHELSHGAVAVLTGGSIDRIEINEMLGGVCYTRGGWGFLIVSSGYIGSMVLGGAIMLLAARSGSAKAVGIVVGAGAIILSLLFVRNLFGLIYGLLFGILLLVMVRFLPSAILETVVRYLGAVSCLYALVDVKEDLLTLQPRLTDAAILEGMTAVPAIVWGIAWIALSLAVFILIFRAAFLREKQVQQN
jgi:hypothetical protein